jgi:hypothetical protein
MNRLVIAVAVVTTLTSAALAGRQLSRPVVVDLAARKAYGSLGSTRNSPDSLSMIGCSVHYDAVNRRNNLNCAAMDAQKNAMGCASQQAELIQIALGINGDSYLEISWEGTTCTNLLVSNSSLDEPKQ